MERKGNFSEESVAIIIREVIRGVHHMHSHSILHRDIKPENIVLTHVFTSLM
jgi:serine/threonine protein kinase